MNVTLLNGLLEGGAANAARQLHLGLRKKGVASRLYFAPFLRRGPQPDDISAARWPLAKPGIAEQWRRWAKYVDFRLHRSAFKAVVRGRPGGHEIFTSPRGAPETTWPPLNHPRQDREILHLHWVAKFIDYASFFPSLPAGQPVVWTLHDMNPFTGGCHFAVDCQRFRQGCGNCPQLPTPAEDDLSREFFGIKQQALQGVPLHVVAASRWMLEQAQASPIFAEATFHRIPYGLNLERYQPVEKRRARAELGLDPDAFVFAFGAVDIENRRKGAALLLEALQAVADVEGAVGLVLGGGDLPAVETPLPRLQKMGFVKEVERRTLIYSACDLFVLPSTEDNMPLTGLEALASATPIVGFEAGGIPDFVRAGETGLLAEKGNAAELGTRIRYFAEQPEESARMGRRARQVAETEYSDDREAEDYIELYASLLADVTR